MTVSEEIRNRAIRWLKSNRSFGNGIAIMLESGFKPAVVRKLAKLGATAPAAMERLTFLIRELITVFGNPKDIDQVEDTDAILHVFAGEEAPADADEESSRAILAVAERIEQGKEEAPDNMAKIIHEYASQYKKREMAFREMASLEETNTEENMARRKQLSTTIEQCTDLMEKLYPYYDAYLSTQAVPTDEDLQSISESSMASNESKVSIDVGESSKASIASDSETTAYLSSLPTDQLKKQKDLARTRITRARNKLDYQADIQLATLNPLPDGPRRLKLENKIKAEEHYVELIEYELAKRVTANIESRLKHD